MTVDLTAFASRLPARGETVLGTGFTMVPGGKGANQAMMSARMGAPTWMVGTVGDDPFHRVVFDGLASQGVRTEHVRSMPGARTGVAHIRVDSRGDNDIVMVPLANDLLTTTMVDEAVAARSADVNTLLLQLEVPAAISAYAARIAQEHGMRVVFDPAPATLVPLPEDLWSVVDVVTPNETEAALITGVAVSGPGSAEEAGRWFLDRGVQLAVITLGAAGAVTVSADGVTHLPVHAVHVVDTVAAGDAFTGAVGAALAQGSGTPEALAAGMAAGALATTVRGASSSLPSLIAVDALRSGHPGAASPTTVREV